MDPKPATTEVPTVTTGASPDQKKRLTVTVVRETYRRGFLDGFRAALERLGPATAAAVGRPVDPEGTPDSVPVPRRERRLARPGERTAQVKRIIAAYGGRISRERLLAEVEADPEIMPPSKVTMVTYFSVLANKPGTGIRYDPGSGNFYLVPPAG